MKQRGPTMRPLVIGGFVLFLIGLIGLNVWHQGRKGVVAVGRPGDPTDIQQVALGQQVYSARCASCHGVNLEGQPNWEQPLPTGRMPAPPHDATGHTWHHNDESFFTTVKFGGQATAPPGYKSNMPALGGVLSDREIWAVLAFIKSTWSPEVLATQQRGHQ